MSCVISLTDHMVLAFVTRRICLLRSSLHRSAASASPRLSDVPHSCLSSPSIPHTVYMSFSQAIMVYING